MRAGCWAWARDYNRVLIYGAVIIRPNPLCWQPHCQPAPRPRRPTHIGAGNKQYVIIAAGGHGSLGTQQGDSVVAFRLKK